MVPMTRHIGFPGGAWARRQGLPLMVALPMLLANGAGGPARLHAPAVDGHSPAVELPATSFPLLADERVDRWVAHFRTDQEAGFRTLLEGHGAYEQLIRNKLRQRGMPQ